MSDPAPLGSQSRLPEPVADRLQDRLDTITEQTRRLVQPERLAPGEQAAAELLSSGIEDRILPVGETAPAFALEDAAGRTVRSTDLLALGPLVINFFRGRWCSYCVNELEAWRDLYPAIREKHALLIAISPQTARQNDFTAGQHQLPFPILHDPRAELAGQFGLTYTVSPSMQQYYRSILVNIPFMNGEPSYRLPLPATYVLAQDATVLYASAFADPKVRPEPSEALAALPS